MLFGISTWSFDAQSGAVPPTFNFNAATGSLPPQFTFSRASNATHYDSTGTLQTAASNAPRFDYDPQTLSMRGLLIEEPKTNLFLNSMAPATQTISLSTGTYTLWSRGSGSVTCAAGTAVGTGFGNTVGGAAGLYGTFVTFNIVTAGTVNFTVNGTVTHCQVEGGTFPTSLIVTAGASVARAMDGVTIADIVGNMGFNPNEGTVLIETMNTFTGASNKQFGFFNSTGAENNCIALSTPNTTASLRASRDGVFAGPNATGVTNYTVNKYASAYKLNDLALSLNGAVPVTTGTADLPNTTLTTCVLGRRNNGTFSQGLNGWLRKLAYYPQRLDNNTLRDLAA